MQTLSLELHKLSKLPKWKSHIQQTATNLQIENFTPVLEREEIRPAT